MIIVDKLGCHRARDIMMTTPKNVCIGPQHGTIRIMRINSLTCNVYIVCNKSCRLGLVHVCSAKTLDGQLSIPQHCNSNCAHQSCKCHLVLSKVVYVGREQHLCKCISFNHILHIYICIHINIYIYSHPRKGRRVKPYQDSDACCSIVLRTAIKAH